MSLQMLTLFQGSVEKLNFDFTSHICKQWHSRGPDIANKAVGHIAGFAPRHWLQLRERFYSVYPLYFPSLNNTVTNKIYNKKRFWTNNSVDA